MVADMGFANAMSQAGAFEQLSAVSTTSGAAWFSTQFFTSNNFFQSTAHSTAPQLASFVTQWMESYVAMQNAIPSQSACEVTDWFEKIFGELLGDANVTQMCDLFVYYKGDWATFIKAMLLATSTGYGDATFVERAANAQNFVTELSHIDLLIQMSLAPNSKVLSDSTTSYLSPDASGGSVLDVPLGAVYAIRNNRETDFYLTSLTGQGNQTLFTQVAPAPQDFYLEDYSEFYLFPNTNGTLLVDLSTPTTTGTQFQVPFGGAPTVTQVAAASSAAEAVYSGTVPSAMAQALSVQEAKLEASGDLPKFAVKAIIDEIGHELYTNALLQNLDVCSSWPADCTSSDGRLMDGGFTDGPSVARNIGQFQSVDQGDPTATIKMIVADHKTTNETNVHVLSYFSTTFNANVSPGGFVWLPSSTGSPALNTPVQSPQIFQEYMDENTYKEKFLTLDGTNVTYAILQATTIDNAAFGVVGGQPVELLVLHTNSDIPTALLGADYTTAYIEPLANMAESIAGSSQLVQVIKSFVQSTN
jgi:hypothetical protein